MTDAHCHVSGGDPTVREFLIGRDFVGTHPWDAEGLESLGDLEDRLRKRLYGDLKLGVGEIGLDRLKSRDISRRMHDLFDMQLRVALEFNRPVVLHGAKCWGQVVKTLQTLAWTLPGLPGFLFHGFSRSDGLIPDIVKLNGYVSVGPAVLNDHAVNYRALVKKIPLDRLLIETDRTEDTASDVPAVAAVATKVAELRGVPVDELEAITDSNADAFLNRSAPAARRVAFEIQECSMTPH